MRKVSFKLTLLTISTLVIVLLGVRYSVAAKELYQIPTGSVPTVTGTQVAAIATVLQNEQGFANLRAGPNTLGYEIVGVLLVGQQVPALGRSPGGNWILIAYPGAPNGMAWIFSDLVGVVGTLEIVQPPPTITPRTTPTLDPTLAAQFPVEIQPTRLPTYTAPPPLILATLPGGNSIPVSEEDSSRIGDYRFRYYWIIWFIGFVSQRKVKK